MNRFVFFYILELIALLVLVVMPNERVDLKFILIMGGISLVLIIITASFKESHKLDAWIMLVLLVFLHWSILVRRYDMIDRYKFDEFHTFCYAEWNGKREESRGKSTSHYFVYQFKDGSKCDVSVDVDRYYEDSLYREVLLQTTPTHEILKNNVVEYEKRKYKYPVDYKNNLEYGNDSYDYYVIEPYIALNNFGLRRVFRRMEGLHLVLYYKNINPDIDSLEYRCDDKFQTQANRDTIGEGFGFYFLDGVYSKEQVFEKIPLAKEYYDKYYKDAE
ncbi:MAG: hypothetical protein J6U21_09215 [Bacteroidales bacterium]|nr:hypothetical protein [Bacteroidales bacterium]